MLKGRPVYIVDGSRSPFLKARGKPGPFTAADLSVAAGKPLLNRLPFSSDCFDEVILGCVMPGPNEVNIARIAALRLGCGESTPAWTVQRNCASGLQALDSAARNIASGEAELILAGGVDTMSRAPVLLNDAMVGWLSDFARARSVTDKLVAISKLRPAYFKPVIGLLCGLRDPVVDMSMGQTAEKLAFQFKLSREEIDSYALLSQQRLAAAVDNGFLEELVAVYDSKGKFYDQDDGLRRDSSLANLAKLKPVFDRKFGKITAGNSAQVTDGAAWLVLASEKAVKQYELPVMGRLIDTQWAALDPSVMGLGPVHAMTPLLKRRRLKMDDIDYWEINEAFAAQVLACRKAWADKDYCREKLHLRSAFGEL
ncbi:MAG: acetyl-CoA C-acetyltransferase, partial [Gammaproteobacteria bacterium]|nr:acetyl-CoA C-acetyltransferase [Gammaproteobacteria bacterium]